MTEQPIVTEHDGVTVIRDDLFPGGTKARFLGDLFEGHDEVVYASPAEGGAQTALAAVAQRLGKKATIFVAKRAEPHPRALMAKAMGAQVALVKPGYLNVVQARARAYCDRTGAFLVPFGANVPSAPGKIAQAALSTGLEPDEVWCAGGSGVLHRGLCAAWPHARHHIVQVGRDLAPETIGRATLHVHKLDFSQRCKTQPPFPSDPHYDAKAWEICQERKGSGLILFWNVTGPAEVA